MNSSSLFINKLLIYDIRDIRLSGMDYVWLRLMYFKIINAVIDDSTL